MACSIHKCVTHKLDYNDEPCRICFHMGDLLIEPTQVSLRTDGEIYSLYKVIEPFTQENLLSLNEIDSQEPDAYVRALKRATLKRESHFITKATRRRRYRWNSPEPISKREYDNLKKN